MTTISLRAGMARKPSVSPRLIAQTNAREEKMDGENQASKGRRLKPLANRECQPCIDDA